MSSKCDRKPGELTHTDVWGPAHVSSLQGYRYYVSIIDDVTRHCTISFMKTKYETMAKVKQYLVHIEHQHSLLPKAIRADNGCEYINKDLQVWCLDRGLEIQTTTPYTPEQNGIAERWNKTVVKLARSMILACDLPNELWPEAMSHATYIRNRAYMKAVLDKTPHEKWLGQRPNILFVQEFGHPVWILNQELNASKLDARARQYIFIGYVDGPKAIKYYDSLFKTIKVSREYRWPMHTTSPLAGQRLEGEYGEHDKPPSVAQDQPGMKRKATDNKEAEMRAKYQKGDKMDLPMPKNEIISGPSQWDEWKDPLSINNSKKCQTDELQTDLPSSIMTDQKQSDGTVIDNTHQRQASILDDQDKDDVPDLYQMLKMTMIAMMTLIA